IGTAAGDGAVTFVDLRIDSAGAKTLQAAAAAGSPVLASAMSDSFTVARGNQTISFGALADKRFDQGPVPVGATASAGLAVTFSSTTPSVCTSGGANGATITFVATGTCTIQADQAGDANWNAAPPVSQGFTVTKGNQTISFGALANKTFDQSPIT